MDEQYSASAFFHGSSPLRPSNKAKTSAAAAAGKDVSFNAVSVKLDNFSISTKGSGPHGCRKKFIVHPLKITIPSAKLFGIMGGSGSGKTTLLNVLAGRYTGSAYDMEMNKIYFSKANSSVGYVTQQDFLLPHLTVHETLLFTAKLKISIEKLPDLLSHRLDMNENDPSSTLAMEGVETVLNHVNGMGRLESGNIHEKTSKEINELYDRLVLDVINDLGLSDRVHARIGDGGGATGKRGLSGGEKRRVSVGLQVLTDPEVLCADEPTSGLDSFTAVVVMEKLKKLTTRKKRQITVICSIHQPRADVFDLFDHVLILTKGGEAVYCGAVTKMVHYFTKKGFPCPEDANPADYYIDQSSIEKDNPESVQRVRLLIEEFNKDKDILQQEVEDGMIMNEIVTTNPSAANKTEISQMSLASMSDKINPSTGIGWFQQYILLLQRFWVNNWRDTSHISGGLIQAICLGLMVMGIFWQLDESTTGIESRSGLIYINVSMEQYILMIILVERYCRDLKIFDRELQDNLYHPTAYYLAHITTSLPTLTFQSIIYSIPIYFGCNLREGWSHVLMFFAVNVFLAWVLNGLVWMCLSASRIFSVASLIANMNFTFISLTAGFLVNYNTMPVYIGWVKNISCLSYAYRILMNNEFDNRTIGDCPPGYESSCDGNDIQRSYGVKPNYVLVPWIILIVIAFVYYSVAAITLTYLRFPPNGTVVVDPNAQEDDDNDFFVSKEAGNEDTGNRKIAVIAADSCEVSGDLENGGISVPIPPPPSQPSSPGKHSTNSPLSVDPIDGTALTSAKDFGVEINVASVTLTARTSSNAFLGTPETKRILKDIDLTIQPSRLVAIMGGSGSGKTTLLNLIANRIPQSALQPIGYHTVPEGGSRASHGKLPTSLQAITSSHEYAGEGAILFGGMPQSPLFIRKNMGYVEQFDHHLPTLTVEETMQINGKLRMPINSSSQDISNRVNNILQRLALTHCRHVRVGNEEMKGISGGEKRRLSIGIQLLTDPAILLLDEPTTGLDAFTARHVVETLKKEVNTRRQQSPYLRTLVLTIHQPRYDIFREIDDVILLSKAELVYAGPAKDVKAFFERVLGVECPHMHNPADFILDYSSIDNRGGKTEESMERRDKLVQTFRIESRKPTISETTSLSANAHTSVAALTTAMRLSEIDDTKTALAKPFYFAAPLLIKRSFLHQVRQPQVSTTRLTQGLFFALILCAFYAPLGSDQDSIQNRIGALYELTALCFIGMLSAIALYPSERDVFYREYIDGYYRVSSFISAYVLLSLPMLIVTAIGIAVLSTFAIGLKQTLLAVGQFSYVIFCFLFNGECLGIIFCSIFDEVGFSVNVVSPVISFLCIMAGYISLSMPQFLIDLSYVSPAKWGSYLLSNIAFQDQTFKCNANDDGYNCLQTGSEVLGLYGLHASDGKFGMEYHYWMLGIITLIYFIIALAAVRGRAWKLSH